MSNGFKETAEINYPAKKIFKIFKKMIKQDFPRFNEKEAIGTSTKKTIGQYTTKSAEAYIEITDYKENEVYEITTITSKTKATFISRYELEFVDENTTRLSLHEHQGGEGFFISVNYMVQKMFFKKRFSTRFNYFIKGLENELEQEKERTAPKKKIVAETAISSDDAEFDIKEKENISE